MATAIEELRKSAHLSASGITDFTTCPLLYRFSRIDKLESGFDSAELHFGSAIHKALERLYRFRMEGKKLFKPELLLEFEAAFMERVLDNPKVRFKDGKDFASMLAEGKALLEVYCEHYPQEQYKTLFVEEPFSFEVEGVDVPLVGVMDLVEEDPQGTIIITDWKTAARAYNTVEVDNNIQLLLYQMAVKQMGYEDREIILKFDVLLKLKTPKLTSYYTTRTEQDEDRFIRKVQMIAKGMEHGLYYPTNGNWKCSYCQYKETACKNWQ